MAEYDGALDTPIDEATDQEEVPTSSSLPPAAYLLSWNPSRFEWPSERFAKQIGTLDRGEPVSDTWSVANRQVQPGDRFFLIRLGDGTRGIFASGRFTTGAVETPHYDPELAAQGKTRYAAGIEFVELVDPWSQPILEQKVLEEELPTETWSPQSSGIKLPPAAAARAEYLWQVHLHRNRVPFRLVHDVDQLRASMATFAEALGRRDERTKYAIFHPTYFVHDPATGRIAPTKWAGIRGMDALVYSALQQAHRELGNSVRGHYSGWTAKHLASLLDCQFEPDSALTTRLARDFEVAFGAQAVANRKLDDLRFTRVPADVAAPGAAVQYWKIAPETGGTLWPLWREQGIATIGWGELGDLSTLDEKGFEARLADQLAAHPEWGRAGPRQAWRFRHIRVGDRIVANVGTTRVVGVGTVTGEYSWTPGENHGHRIRVRWDDVRERAVARGGWRKTLIGLTKEDFDSIVAEAERSPHPEQRGNSVVPPRGIDFDSIVAALEDKQLHFESELVANLLIALQTKRFVILSGISGTGKTRLALEVARVFRPSGTDAYVETPEDAVDIVVRPYMRKYKRLIVPAQIAAQLMAEVGEEATGSIPVESPAVRKAVDQSYYARIGTNVFQLLLKGPTKDWFLEHAEGDVVRIERFDVAGKERSGLRLSIPSASTRMPVAEHVEVIPVRPDWTDSRGLLGFYNPLTQQYSTTRFLELLLRAAENSIAASSASRTPDPFFVILDEMNLARVEHYFADFLSAMESGEPIELHQDVSLESGETEQGIVIPRKLVVPPNLFFIGTVNVDETTYLFSPKVLDRAFTLEFNAVDLAGYGAATEEQDAAESPLDLERFDGRLEMGRLPAPADWAKLAELEEGRLRQVVIDVNRLLEAENRHFGYRVANEIGRFVMLAVAQAGPDAAWPALDLALLQKVLPKLHGTQQELEQVLDRLHAFGQTGVLPSDGAAQPPPSSEPSAPRLPRFIAKLARMRRRLAQQGFASFIE